VRPDLTGLTALLAVAEKRSFTAAAAELRVTPSAVSQTVRALEERLGVQLLTRTTRSVGLTEAGSRFVERLRPAIEGVEDAFASVGELRDRPAGVLRLNLPRLGYDLVLASRLPAFLAAYPDVGVDLCIDDKLTDIVGDGFDAGLRLGETVQRDMIAVRVSPAQRVAVVASPKYFATRGKPKHPRELRDHDCINFRQTRGSVYRWEFTENGKDFDLAVDGRVLTNDGAVMLDAASAGLGVAYVLESQAKPRIEDGTLTRVLERWCQPFPGFFLYYPQRSRRVPKLEALVGFMKVR
jgi:DNA-binding transcriptional LysR family regulator